MSLNQIKYYYTEKQSAAKIGSIIGIVAGIALNQHPISCALASWAGHFIGSYFPSPLPMNDSIDSDAETLKDYLKDFNKNFNPYRNKYNLQEDEGLMTDMMHFMNRILGKEDNVKLSSISSVTYLVFNYFQSNSYLENFFDAMPALLLIGQGMRMDKVPASILGISLTYSTGALNNFLYYFI